MDRNKILKTLEETGLSEKESRIYHAALISRASTVSELARLAEIKRPTAYFLVDSLKAKGLISSQIIKSKTLYVAENPERIEAVIDQKKQSYKNVLPKLLELFNLKDKSSDIRRYEGITAIKKIYNELISNTKKNDFYLSLCDLQKWQDLDPKFFKEFIQKRAKLKLNIKILTTDSDYARQRKEQEKIHNDNIRFLPPKTKLTTNLVVTSSKVLIHELTAPVGATVIKSQSTVQMHKEMFEIIWVSQGPTKEF